MDITYLFYLGIGYLLGSIPFGLILTYVAGKGDVRKIGSGNIGATNVLRTGHKFLALLTLVLDASKGAIIIILLFHIARYGIATLDAETITFKALITGLGSVVGHCFPVWLKFKGGKGVSTTLGVLLAAVPWAGVLACVTWGIMAGFFRISSLSALVAIAVAPIATFLIYGAAPAIVTIFIALLVFWRHKANIQRLLKGEEPKIGAKT